MLSTLLIVIAFTVVTGIALARTRYREKLFSADAWGYYIHLPSLVIDGDLDYWNQFTTDPSQRTHDFYDVAPGTGLTANGYQVGCALLWMPMFVLAHLVVLGLNALGMNIPADGFGPAYEWPVYVWAFAIGLVGLWYMRRLLDELWGRAVANVTLVYMLFATALAAYVWFEPVMSHLASVTLITMFVYYLHRILQANDSSILAWARLGVLLGLIAMVRAPDALVSLGAAAAGWRVAFRSSQAWRERLWIVLKCGLTIGLVSFVTFIPQMLAWKILFGHYLIMPVHSNYDRTNWLAPDFFNYLFCVRRGLFLWTPLALAAVIGLAIGVRRGPAIVGYAALIFVLGVYFNSSIYMWWIGDSFVDRRLVDYYVFLTLGLGSLFSLRPSLMTRWQFHAGGLLLIAFNWILMLRYFTHDLPESAALSLDDLYLKTLTFPLRFAERFLL